MYDLETIKAMNEKGGAATVTPHRPCSMAFRRRGDGLPTGVVIHSASHRDTKCVDLTDLFQREFFRRVCELYDTTFHAVSTDWEEVPTETIDKIVESYWGLYPQPDQESTPGYAEAQPV